MLRICLWVLIGAAVTCFWTLVMMAAPGHNIGHWTVVTITVPASLLGRHGPVTYYTVMFLNAAIYGLAGLALEPLFRLRRQLPAGQH
jgi:hypothetical protein